LQAALLLFLLAMNSKYLFGRTHTLAFDH
jgi:hypothetical protein